MSLDVKPEKVEALVDTGNPGLVGRQPQPDLAQDRFDLPVEVLGVLPGAEDHHHEVSSRAVRSRPATHLLVMVSGDREHADEARDVVAAVLAPMGLRRSEAKTMIAHVDEGLDFLGWRIQRHRKRGPDRRLIYTYPAKKALKAVMAKVKMICRQNNNEPLAVLLRRLNPVLRGWATYFRTGVSASTFRYLSKYAWERVMRWIRRKHRKITWKELRRRFCGGGWWPTDGQSYLFDPGQMQITRSRGTKIPTPRTAAS